MRKNKYIFVFVMLLAIAVAGGIFTTVYVRMEKNSGTKGTLQVVASFYPIYIAAENVIGDNPDIKLQSLSEPQTGCMHDYQLTPQDMITLSEADVFLVNGGGIENFLAEVAKEYPKLMIIQATEGMELLGEEKAGHEEHDHGGENAHAWMNTELYNQMVQNIADGLSEADKSHAKEYQEHALAYGRKIEALTGQIEELKKELSGKNVIVFHEAYEYIAEQCGMNVMDCLDLDEERQVSAGEIARIMKEIEEGQVSAVLAEELYGKDMGTTVEKESECPVYYLDSLVRGNYEKDSYLNAMQRNIDFMRVIAGKE